MKRMKELLTLFVALVMALALALPTFAVQQGELTGGRITIKNALPGKTYTIYQILYLESYNAKSGAYAYKANSAWESWLKDADGGAQYVSIDSQGYVTWRENADPAAFAKAALSYAKTPGNQIGYDDQKEAPAAKEGEQYSTVTFENLRLGYYLVDTTAGSLCSLDTTNPSVEMKEKNEIPSVDKEVQEGSDGPWGKQNTAQIGDTVNFRTTITIKRGAQNYVLHDEMSEGLTLVDSSIKVLDSKGQPLDKGYYTVSISTSTSPLSDGCDFHITFTQDYLDTIASDTTVTVTYSAVLNGNAEISTDPNTNMTYLGYGDDHKTTWDETKTYTFKFDIVKTKSDHKLLGGAEFELYDAETKGNKIPLVDEGNGVYRVATKKEANVEGFESAVIEATNGRATVTGLDANTTYWLEETKAPAGYNKLDGRVMVKIENGNLITTMEGDIWASGDGGVQITNETGSELPSTGGMGTTLFYIGGGVLVVLAVALLVVKKRRGEE